MKKLFLLIMFLWLMAILSANAQLNSRASARLQSVLDSTCKKYNIKGASAAILVPNIGTWKGTSGISHPGEAVTSEMLFGIGSNTKTYTATIMLKLQEMGKLSLNDTIGNWIHDQRYINGKITIREILNHTSGIFNFTENPNLNDSISADFSRIWKPEEALEFVSAPLFKPGASWSYSNTNYVIAGIIIKQVMNQPYEVTLRNFILDPQGFANSIFCPLETTKAPIANQWSMGVNGQNELPIFGISGYTNNAEYSFAGSAGAIMQTAEDNVNFWHNLTTGKIINMSSLSQMKKFVMIGTGPSGGAVGYGLGMFRYLNMLNGHPIYEHGGTIIGFIGENAVDTITGVCFSVLTNQDSVSNDIVLSDVIGTLHKVTLEMNLAGVEEISNQFPDIKIYPNPAKDILNIDCGNNGTNDIRIYNTEGREVAGRTTGGGTTQINVSQLPEGLYIARIISKESQSICTQKIVISR